MGKNKNGYYNYKVIVYNNRDRTDIKEEKLFKERHEVVDEYGLSISSITKMCKIIGINAIKYKIRVSKIPNSNILYYSIEWNVSPTNRV